MTHQLDIFMSGKNVLLKGNKCKLFYFISVHLYCISSYIFSLNLIYYNNPGWLKSPVVVVLIALRTECCLVSVTGYTAVYSCSSNSRSGH